MLGWSDLLCARTQRLLHIIAFVVTALSLRVSYLALYRHHELERLAQRPAQKVEPISAARGCIFDRQGQALATNRLCYEVGICYRDFTAFPAVRTLWQGGKREKTFPRKQRIKNLASMLACELQMGQQQVEDFIYSQAALNPTQTIILKSHLSEQSFYRLKAKEAFFAGLRVQSSLSRFYPYGPLAGQILGYVGRVNQGELRLLQEELASLQSQLSIEEDEASQQLLAEKMHEARLRIRNLEEIIGKAGIELLFEDQLRGCDGLRIYQASPKGYASQKEKITLPIAGSSITLAIDSRLQLLAEQLLAENESIRDELLEAAGYSSAQTWIKGGAIVVMDPNNGEVLALASYPRFDPEAFMQAQQSHSLAYRSSWQDRHFWLEDKKWIAKLWNGTHQLQRQVYDRSNANFTWQSKPLSWRYCLESICGPQSPLIHHFNRFKNIAQVLAIAQAFARLKSYLGNEIDGWSLVNFLYNRSQDTPFWPKHVDSATNQSIVEQRWLQVVQALPVEAERKILDNAVGELSSNFDKMLFIELCGLLIDEEAFGGAIPQALANLSLEAYRMHCASYFFLSGKIKALAQRWHEEVEFSKWRDLNQRQYLKDKRREEKSLGLIAKPYLFHLEHKKKILFEELWQAHSKELIWTFVSQGACEASIFSMVQFIEKHLHEDPEGNFVKATAYTLKELCDLLGQRNFGEYVASMTPFERLQKVLWAQYPLLRQTKVATRQDLAARVYPRYGLGYMTNKAISHLSAPGSVFKLILAYEALFQRYQRGFGQTWEAMSPFKIIDANYKKGSRQVVARWISGKEIGQIHRGGRVPKSRRNYIGEIDLLGAIESSSNPYFALLADMELSDGPQDLLRAGYKLGWGARTGIDLPFERSGSLPYDLANNRTGLYTSAIGQHTLLGTPMQSTVMMAAIANGGQILRPKIILDGAEPDVRWTIALPTRVQEYLLEGMRRAVSGENGTAKNWSVKLFGPGTQERKSINKMAPYMVGKTSTAEFVEVAGITPPKTISKRNHLWFTGIVFDQPLYSGQPPDKVAFQGKRPELVITVCLHHGKSGKEAFPLAALLASYWKQIREKDRDKALDL